MLFKRNFAGRLFALTQAVSLFLFPFYSQPSINRSKQTEWRARRKPIRE